MLSGDRWISAVSQVPDVNDAAVRACCYGLNDALRCLLPRGENTLPGSWALAEKGSGAPQIGKKLSEQNLDKPVTKSGCSFNSAANSGSEKVH